MKGVKMTDKTKKLLLECKKAGYEFVTVLCRDQRVPLSKKIKSGFWFGNQPTIAGPTPTKVICASPERLGKHYKFSGEDWPKMWSIVKKLGLTNGIAFDGYGLGDAHDIHPVFIDSLTSGCYDLAILK